MQAANDMPDTGAGSAAPVDDGTDRKAYTLLKWQAAKIQQTLTKTPGGYFISRWGQSRHCDSLDEVRAVLARMGGDR